MSESYKFPFQNRQGADELKKAGYFEIFSFKEDVLNQINSGRVIGYFCATCEYLKYDQSAMNKVICTKLNNAHDDVHGCCNFFDFDNNKPNEIRKYLKNN